MRTFEISSVVPGGVVNHLVKETDARTAALSYWKHRMHKPYAFDWKSVSEKAILYKDNYRILED